MLRLVILWYLLHLYAHSRLGSPHISVRQKSIGTICTYSSVGDGFRCHCSDRGAICAVLSHCQKLIAFIEREVCEFSAKMFDRAKLVVTARKFSAVRAIVVVSSCKLFFFLFPPDFVVEFLFPKLDFALQFKKNLEIYLFTDRKLMKDPTRP